MLQLVAVLRVSAKYYMLQLVVVLRVSAKYYMLQLVAVLRVSAKFYMLQLVAVLRVSAKFYISGSNKNESAQMKLTQNDNDADLCMMKPFSRIIFQSTHRMS